MDNICPMCRNGLVNRFCGLQVKLDVGDSGSSSNYSLCYQCSYELNKIIHSGTLLSRLRALPPSTGAPDLRDERKAFEAWWPTVGQTIGEVAAWAAWQARAALPLQPAGDLREAISGDDLEWLLAVAGTYYGRGSKVECREGVARVDKVRALLGGGKKEEGDAQVSSNWGEKNTDSTTDGENGVESREEGEPVAQGLPVAGATQGAGFQISVSLSESGAYHLECDKLQIYESGLTMDGAMRRFAQDFEHTAAHYARTPNERLMPQAQALKAEFAKYSVESPSPATRSDEVAEGPTA